VLWAEVGARVNESQKYVVGVQVTALRVNSASKICPKRLYKDKIKELPQNQQNDRIKYAYVLKLDATALFAEVSNFC
jgi:hypothetical protein